MMVTRDCFPRIQNSGFYYHRTEVALAYRLMMVMLVMQYVHAWHPDC